MREKSDALSANDLAGVHIDERIGAIADKTLSGEFGFFDRLTLHGLNRKSPKPRY
jgi:hypothetical protein